MTNFLNKFTLSKDVRDITAGCKGVIVPENREQLVEMSFGGPGAGSFEVSYEVDGKNIVEADIVRCKNGAAVNFTEDYMRRRDPDCLVIADELPTNKPRFSELYGEKFDRLRGETFEWLKKQELIILPFMAGGAEYGSAAIMIAPKNAAFIAAALADLQCFVNIDDHQGEFKPELVIYLAPPFRHIFFKGRQIVVHNRASDIYEMFSYNLYPGPSVKKGVYGFLLDHGERNGWVTAHASAVKVTSPYDHEVVIMHEGASGSGKSEMGENIHREPDGKILLGENTVYEKEKIYITLDEACTLAPVSDDMTLVHPEMQNDSRKLVIKDAENGWFLRVDQTKKYGTDPRLERLCIHPPLPLIFLNLQAVAGSTCLIWEHTIDSNGKPCPNPRVIVPRDIIEGVVHTTVEVDVRSFGVRTPPCTRKNPSYGIIGMMHILPPALAWLWRLVAPRGHNNPSIIDSAGMTSEGIGSYDPFLPGSIVTQANLLLEQIINSPNTCYVLFPNQHIGAYKVGFMPQWISREYLARHGARFNPGQLVPARSALLGYALDSLKINGQHIKQGLLRPETQAQVDIEGYDAGAKILIDFFKKELAKFNTSELHPVGGKIIQCCLNDAVLEDYIEIIKHRRYS